MKIRLRLQPYKDTVVKFRYNMCSYRWHFSNAKSWENSSILHAASLCWEVASLHAAL